MKRPVYPDLHKHNRYNTKHSIDEVAHFWLEIFPAGLTCSLTSDILSVLAGISFVMSCNQGNRPLNKGALPRTKSRRVVVTRSWWWSPDICRPHTRGCDFGLNYQRVVVTHPRLVDIQQRSGVNIPQKFSVLKDDDKLRIFQWCHPPPQK